MAKRMLVDATQPEETRVVVVSGNRLEDLDFEIASKKQLKGNIYLAKVTRVEPSLQAAFIEYGGNRHGFLAFSEIHPDYYRIPVADREALLAEERRMAALAEEADDDEPPRRVATPAASPVPSPSGSQLPAAPMSSSPVSSGLVPSGPAALVSTPLDETSATSSLITMADLLSGHDGAAVPTRGRGGDGYGLDQRPLESGDVGVVNLGEDVGVVPAMAEAIPVISLSSEPEEAEPSTAGNTDGADDRVVAEQSSVDAGAGSGAETEAGHDAEADVEADADAVSASDDHPESVNIDELGGDEVEEVAEMAQRRHRPLRSYKIQEVIKRRQILLVQVTKDERGSKGAALTTYLSLPGRYCVLMPNSGRGGGVSRKITNPQDRKRLKEILSDLDIPQGMAVILRTAGLERSKAEIKRDLEYLLRLWDSIREQTLESTAPELIYEEANLIKRSIRDLHANDIDEVLVEGERGYRLAKDFMRMLVPSHSKRVQPYRDESIPLFFRYHVESQIDAIHSPVVQLKSGGYIVINQTEALVAIDVNSGRSTRERNIEETAYKTNLEAADEVARQLRLRDLAGLIVVDFIDMEDSRNNASVERRIKEAMKTDRARIQLGRISPFGLLELSRQRLRPSLMETNFEKCPHCAGTGLIRNIESAALHILRAIEEEGIRRRSAEISVAVATAAALYILNSKRTDLAQIEQRYGMHVVLLADDSLILPDLRLERVRARVPGDDIGTAISADKIYAEVERSAVEDDEDEDEANVEEVAEVERPAAAETAPGGGEGRGDRRNGGRGRRGRRRSGGERSPDMAPPPVQAVAQPVPTESSDEDEGEGEDGDEAETEGGGVDAAPQDAGDGQPRKRRRGKRGGRRRGRGRPELNGGETEAGLESGVAEGVSVEGASAAAVEDDVGESRGPDVFEPLESPRVSAYATMPVEDVADFDWGLEGERPGLEQTSVLQPIQTAEAIELAVPVESVDAVVASTEGDSVAVALGDEAAIDASTAGEAGVAGEIGPRKRTRRRASSEATGEAEAAVARRTRRRVKMASNGDAAVPLEIAAEVAPEAAAEIVPEPIFDTVLEPSPSTLEAPLDAGYAAAEDIGIPVIEDSAVIAPTERPDDVPSPSPRRGWWSRG